MHICFLYFHRLQFSLWACAIFLCHAATEANNYYCVWPCGNLGITLIWLFITRDVSAYERLDRSSLSPGLSSSRLCVARVTIVVGNIGIFFWVFLRVLPFLQIHPTNIFYFYWKFYISIEIYRENQNLCYKKIW